MKIPKILIRIAETNILLKFAYNHEKPYVHQYLYTTIQKLYARYIIPYAPNVTVYHDLQFRFLKRPPRVFVDHNDKTHYVEFSRTLSNKTTEIYYHVSLYDVNQLLLKILHNNLISSNGFLLHASSILLKNDLYIFIAPSAGGKSTIAQVANGNLSLFSDDSLAIIKTNDTYHAYQIPESYSLTNEHMPKTAKKALIKHIFVIKKDARLKSRAISKSHLFGALIGQMLTNRVSPNQIQLLQDFSQHLQNKCSLLHFPKDIDANSLELVIQELYTKEYKL